MGLHTRSLLSLAVILVLGISLTGNARAFPSAPAETNPDALPGTIATAGDAPAAGVTHPALDPFYALIQPKEPEIVVVDPKLIYHPPPPPPPPIAPVSFKVNAVAGEHPAYVAVIEFDGQTYIVQPGTNVPDDSSPAFAVKQVSDTKVEVFDLKTKRLVERQLDVN